MDFEPIDEFEKEVRQAFARRPAPPGLKRRLMLMRRQPQIQKPFMTWQKLAAMLVLTALISGGIQWRMMEQRRREEAAREQVLLALRITSHALNQMNARLASRRHGEQD